MQRQIHKYPQNRSRYNSPYNETGLSIIRIYTGIECSPEKDGGMDVVDVDTEIEPLSEHILMT